MSTFHRLISAIVDASKMCTGDGGTRAQEQNGAATSSGVNVLLIEDEIYASLLEAGTKPAGQ